MATADFPVGSVLPGLRLPAWGASNDGLTLSEMWAYTIAPTAGSGTFYLDQVKLYSDNAVGIGGGSEVSLSADTYSVDEGGTALITVTLDVSSGTPVTVMYTTGDGTAIAGSDYLTNTGTLIFAPGEMSKTFQVVTLEDTAQEGDETITLTLSDPEGAVLGAIHEATLTIQDYLMELLKVYPPLINKQPYP